jgi:DNA (cytosine-5)-methyltransferase 1
VSAPRAYYNEIDPYAAQWLRNLIAAGHIAPGDVDERSIVDVRPGDLAGYTQCHFFAGVAGWSLALRLAGWPDDRECWTGSAPCQPFSNTGKQRGFSDERHLWPAWFRLIRERWPPIIFGEQIAKAAVWLDLVLSDLESSGYACGAFDLPAACVGARHIRQRLWFVADADEARWANAQGVPAAETETDIGRPAGVVHRQAVEHLRGAFEPNGSWIVDGLSGEGLAVGAYGNAIVPQVAAEIIGAYLDGNSR